MILFEWILFFFAWLFFGFGIFVIISCFIGLIKYKDFFIRTHAIKISNIYGISFILLANGLLSKSLLIFLQLSAIIVLNILTTITIVHTICRVAMINNITHSSISRRKYNEILEEENKKEEEEIKELKKMS